MKLILVNKYLKKFHSNTNFIESCKMVELEMKVEDTSAEALISKM